MVRVRARARARVRVRVRAVRVHMCGPHEVLPAEGYAELVESGDVVVEARVERVPGVRRARGCDEEEVVDEAWLGVRVGIG